MGNDERMQMIGNAIVAQAQQQSKAVIDEANTIREQEIASYKDQVMEQMFLEVQQQTRVLHSQAVQGKARREQDAHRALLEKRQALTESVFDAVRTRLRQFVATPDYRAQMLEEIAALAGAYDHAGSVVQLREADMGLAGEITQRLPGCTVKAVRSIQLGGFRLRNQDAGILVDETFDQRLTDQRAWFLANCGLKVVAN